MRNLSQNSYEFLNGVSARWDADRVTDERFVKITIEVCRDEQLDEQAQALKWLLQNPLESETITDLACVLSAMIDNKTFEKDVIELYNDEVNNFWMRPENLPF